MLHGQTCCCHIYGLRVLSLPASFFLFSLCYHSQAWTLCYCILGAVVVFQFVHTPISHSHMSHPPYCSLRCINLYRHWEKKKKLIKATLKKHSVKNCTWSFLKNFALGFDLSSYVGVTHDESCLEETITCLFDSGRALDKKKDGLDSAQQETLLSSVLSCTAYYIYPQVISLFTHFTSAVLAQRNVYLYGKWSQAWNKAQYIVILVGFFFMNSEVWTQSSQLTTTSYCIDSCVAFMNQQVLTQSTARQCNWAPLIIRNGNGGAFCSGQPFFEGNVWSCQSFIIRNVWSTCERQIPI